MKGLGRGPFLHVPRRRSKSFEAGRLGLGNLVPLRDTIRAPSRDVYKDSYQDSRRIRQEVQKGSMRMLWGLP